MSFTVYSLVGDQKWLSTVYSLLGDQRWLSTVYSLLGDQRWLSTVYSLFGDQRWLSTVYSLLRDHRWLSTVYSLFGDQKWLSTVVIFNESLIDGWLEIYLLLTNWCVTRSHLLLLAHWYGPQEITCTAYDAPNSTKAQTTYVTGCKRFIREGKVWTFLQLQLVISVIQKKNKISWLTYIIFF